MPEGFNKIKKASSYGRSLSTARYHEMTALQPPPSARRNTVLEALWDKMLTGPNICHSDPNQWRKPALVRPSSFPFCPRFFAMRELGAIIPDDFTTRSNFFTEIGKGVHYVLQNGLAQSGKLWGRWKCARPGCGEMRKGLSLFPRDKKCKACGADKWEYEELTVAAPEIGLRGHVDGVLVWEEGDTHYQSILEVKTADHDKVAGLKKLGGQDISQLFATEAPWYGYGHQARTYATLLREAYPEILDNIRFVDYFIQSRNDPDTYVSFRMNAGEPEDQWWVEIRRRIVAAQAAVANRVLPVGFARNEKELSELPSCSFCEMKKDCLKPPKEVDYVSDELYKIGTTSSK